MLVVCVLYMFGGVVVLGLTCFVVVDVYVCSYCCYGSLFLFVCLFVIAFGCGVPMCLTLFVFVVVCCACWFLCVLWFVRV